MAEILLIASDSCGLKIAPIVSGGERSLHNFSASFFPEVSAVAMWEEPYVQGNVHLALSVGGFLLGWGILLLLLYTAIVVMIPGPSPTLFIRALCVGERGMGKYGVPEYSLRYYGSYIKGPL